MGQVSIIIVVFGQSIFLGSATLSLEFNFENVSYNLVGLNFEVRIQ